MSKVVNKVEKSWSSFWQEQSLGFLGFQERTWWNSSWPQMKPPKNQFSFKLKNDHHFLLLMVQIFLLNNASGEPLRIFQNTKETNLSPDILHFSIHGFSITRKKERSEKLFFFELRLFSLLSCDCHKSRFCLRAVVKKSYIGEGAVCRYKENEEGKMWKMSNIITWVDFRKKFFC